MPAIMSKYFGVSLSSVLLLFPFCANIPKINAIPIAAGIDSSGSLNNGDTNQLHNMDRTQPFRTADKTMVSAPSMTIPKIYKSIFALSRLFVGLGITIRVNRDQRETGFTRWLFLGDDS